MGQWAHLYNTTRWRAIRRRQLDAEPLCIMCEKDGRISLATVCDHIEPHRGDPAKFWNGPFASLCAAHHSSDKQAYERTGKVRQKIGPDGWPVE